MTLRPCCLPDNFAHGTRSQYVLGCRCDACRESNRLAYHERRTRLAGLLSLEHPGSARLQLLGHQIPATAARLAALPHLGPILHALDTAAPSTSPARISEDLPPRVAEYAETLISEGWEPNAAVDRARATYRQLAPGSAMAAK